MTDTPAELTPEQAAEMQAQLNAYYAAEAAEAAAARAEFLEPITTMLASSEYAAVKQMADNLGSQYDAEQFNASLGCLRTGLRNLKAV